MHGASAQDWCYLAFLCFLVASVASGLCSLALQDRAKAYAGGIFLFMFCLFLGCTMSVPYYYSDGGCLWGGLGPGLSSASLGNSLETQGPDPKPRDDG